MKNMSIQGLPEMKGYDPLDTTLKFVTRRDDLDPISSDDDSLRAEMSCGHAVTPESLTQWCRNLLDQGHYTFKCPALVEGTTRCNKAWSYQEVPDWQIYLLRKCSTLRTTWPAWLLLDTASFSHVPSAKQTWRGRIFPTCVSYVSYAQLIRGEPISSAGSVRSHGRAQLLDRTAVATMTASTGTCNCCRHANPSTCRRWRASPAAPLSDSVLHVA
uniref:Uncharacterized protein n=2 Tax=Amphiprion ocellaris TaxID=80972 RepID=A0A3Q1AYU3_AMPOC